MSTVGSTPFLDQTIGVVLNNPPVLLAVAGVIAVIYFLSKNTASEKEKNFEEKNWNNLTPKQIKKKVLESGFDSDKLITRGDFNEIGRVQMYDSESSPSDSLQKLVLPGAEDDADGSSSDVEEVYIFLVHPSGRVSGYSWMLTDYYLNMDKSTMIYIVSEDSLSVEQERFRVDKDIDFQLKHGNMMVEKKTSAQNVVDEPPLSQARQNIVEGVEEFAIKTMFFDRQHTSSVAQMREDIDEDALEEFLNKGKNF